MAGRLLILGAGSHGRAVADVAGECGWAVAGFTDRPGSPRGGEIVGEDADIPMLVRAGAIDAVVVGIGNTALSRRVELFAQVTGLSIALASLVHPRSTVSRSSRVGDGTVVFAGSVLGADVLVGCNVVIYSGVVVEHECRIGDHAYLSPGAVLSGNVVVESGAFLGAGAVVLPGVSIGSHAVVGAGAVVVRDVPAGRTALGVPAQLRSVEP